MTTQSQATKENKKEPGQRDTRKLKAKKEAVTNNGSNNTTTTPLTMEITTSPGRYKPFKMKGKMKANTGFDVFDNSGSSRADIAKAKVVPSMPDEKLADVEHVNENPRHS